jgi:protein TonB
MSVWLLQESGLDVTQKTNLETRQGNRSMLVIIVAGVVVLALAGWGLKQLISGEKGSPKKPPKISLVAPPPPPPPPPPKFEKKPDPPKEQKEMKVEQPVQKQETPPPSPELKMEGPAGNGPSAFGAGKITSEDLSKIGTGVGSGTSTGGMFNPFNNYSNLLKGELQRYLAKNKDLRRRRYTLEVRVWVTPTGGIKRYELAGSTDDKDTDTAIQQALANLSGFSETPPPNMPQPIRLRIVTSG